MEGLLPFLYRAIILYYADGRRHTYAGGSSFIRADSSSASRYYIPLAHDSGRLQFAAAEAPVFTSPAGHDTRLL